jgi:hypothetical protein
MNFNFGEVLSRAWQIVWKNKVLWIFGIFAGCSRGGGGSGGGGGGGGGTAPGNQPFPELERNMEQLGRWISENPWIIAVFILFILLLVVISVFLGTIGRIGLIRGTYQAERGDQQLVFGELFSGSMPYFWRVFGLSLLIVLIAMVIFIPLALFGVITAGIGFLCLLPLICLLIPAMWALSVVIEQANAAIVIENLGIGDGVRKGWEVVRSNPGPMVVLALIIFIGSGVIGFLFALPIIAAVLPLVFGAASNSSGALWTGVACIALYVPILLVLNGLLTAYMQSVWALTYMRLTRPRDNAPVILEANA